MTRFKLPALLVLSAAFTLTSALPAFAGGREDARNAPGARQHQAASSSKQTPAGFSVSGNASGKLTVQRRSAPQSPNRPDFFEKAICSGSCGGISFTCWGDTAFCADGLGCDVTGGGWEITLVCL
jgi:hypothetical protein